MFFFWYVEKVSRFEKEREDWGGKQECGYSAGSKFVKEGVSCRVVEYVRSC